VLQPQLRHLIICKNLPAGEFQKAATAVITSVIATCISNATEIIAAIAIVAIPSRKR
jgi:hypothetical protein